MPSDALLQHLPSYLGFSYLGYGVSLHGCSSRVQPVLLTLDEGYLLTTASPDLEHGAAPLGPPAPEQPRLLGCGVGPPSLLGRKVMTNLDSIFKRRDITLPTNVHLVKAMVFQVVCIDVRVDCEEG